MSHAKHPFPIDPHPHPSHTPERRSLNPATLLGELKERMAQKSFTAASSPDVGEVATEEADDDDWTWIEPFNQRARVFWHVADAGYDIEVVDTDGLTRVMSQVKLPTPNPSGSTAVDLIDGPAADLLRLVMNNLPSFIAMEPLFHF